MTRCLDLFDYYSRELNSSLIANQDQWKARVSAAEEKEKGTSIEMKNRVGDLEAQVGFIL